MCPSRSKCMDSPNGNSEADSALEHTQYQLAECKRQLMLKDDELHLQLQEVQKLRSILSGSKSLFSKNKTVFALTQQLDTLQEKEAQLEPLKAEIRRLQVSLHGAAGPRQRPTLRRCSSRCVC